MGKITQALKKAAEERMERLDKVIKFQEHEKLVVRKMKDSAIDARLIAYFDQKSVISEQYKILSTNLLSLNKGKSQKIFGLTSSIHSEGKTVSALNLAITLAQAVQKPKILLIDADMRRGRLARYLGVQQDKGLSEVLSAQTQINDVLFHIDIENLTFMAAGAVPANPAELLASNSMKDLLAQLRPQFDYILIDTPPVIPVTDPVIISSLVDGMIVVVQAGRTQRGMVKRTAEQLEQSHAKITGYILTGIEYFVPDYIYRYL